MSLVAAFPLGTAYLPGEAVILRVFEPRYVRMLDDLSTSTNMFVTTLIEAGSEVGGGEKRFDTGVLVAVDHVAAADFGFHLFAHAERAVDIVSWNDDLDYARAEISVQSPVTGDRDEAHRALVDVATDIRSFVNRVRELGLAPGEYPHLDAVLDVSGQLFTDEELWSSFWRLAGLVPCTPMDKYEFLRDGTLVSRAQRVRGAIAHMNDLLTFRYG